MGVGVLVLAWASWAGLVASTSRSQLARSIVWGESDMDDHRRFPARRVAAGPDRFHFTVAPGVGDVPPPELRRVSVAMATRWSSGT
jgi:hypothetical protein